VAAGLSIIPGIWQRGGNAMQNTIRVFSLVILVALLGGPVSGFAAGEPVNQCIMIPEIFVGPSTSSNYQPESCITFRMDDQSHYAYAADFGSHADGD
jgi:hypothetical protein